MEVLEASLRRTKPEIRATMMGRVAEAWLEQGRSEGELKGRAEGELTGRAELLLEQLERRFGELPATVRHRVRRAEVSELRSWAAAVLDASSLDEVLATGSKN
ncbi:MAG: DUF4351 domain-containing protein [Albidovulum sp.]|nr:DUF4351 domain-containing protein [Albidovulum sp.]